MVDNIDNIDEIIKFLQDRNMDVSQDSNFKAKVCINNGVPTEMNIAFRNVIKYNSLELGLSIYPLGLSSKFQKFCYDNGVLMVTGKDKKGKDYIVSIV